MVRKDVEHRAIKRSLVFVKRQNDACFAFREFDRTVLFSVNRGTCERSVFLIVKDKTGLNAVAEKRFNFDSQAGKISLCVKAAICTKQ